MVQRITRENNRSNWGVLPVVIPATLLLLLTGGVRTYTYVSAMPGQSQEDTAKQSRFGKGLNPTEETFAQYATILELLNKNQEEEALSRLRSLLQEPLSMDGNTFRDAHLSHFSPETLLLSVTQTLAKRAQISAKNGDNEMAGRYVDALYGVGDHVLSNPSPSLKALESAHHFLGFAARMQVSVFAKGDYYGAAARYREWALTTLWKKRISPRIESNSSTPNGKNEKILAANLAREYRDGWSRIRAGEA
ncbi:MAG: hypothetical protein H8F28_02095 [Fibrella sp.]|nr:hypothetical protein [Armatimonadota bacterium]